MHRLDELGVMLAHFTSVLANQLRPSGKTLRARDLWRIPGANEQQRSAEASHKAERNQLVSIEAERRKRRRHLEEIGPQAIPVRVGERGKKKPESPEKKG